MNSTWDRNSGQSPPNVIDTKPNKMNLMQVEVELSESLKRTKQNWDD